MTTKTLLCSLCPNCCALTVTMEGEAVTGCTGNLCTQGADFARQELTMPLRNVTTSVAVSGGLYPLCSVRLSAPIPLSRLTEAVDLLHGLTVTAPVAMGQVLLEDLLGLGVQVLSTRSVPAIHFCKD